MWNRIWKTAADMTTRCASKIEDTSRGPGRVHFEAPDEGFGFEGTPKPKIQKDPPPQKGTLYVVRRCISGTDRDTLKVAKTATPVRPGDTSLRLQRWVGGSVKKFFV